MIKRQIIRIIKVLLIPVTVVFLFSTSINTLSPQSTNMKDRFYLGTFNFFFDSLLRTPFYSAVYESLSYNAMQSYGAHIDTIPLQIYPGHNFDAGFFDTLDYYRDFTNGILDDWEEITNLANPRSLLFEREKILRPAYGQRSTYQAEANINLIPKYYYSTHETGNDITDNGYGGVTVRYCSKDTNSAGYVVSGLIENGEQSNMSVLIDSSENSSGRSLYSDIKKNNYKYRWYIKPRIRIDSNYAKQYPDTLVVKIEIHTSADSIICLDLKCFNFLDNSLNYNGSYLEVYNNLLDSLNLNYLLAIPAVDLTGHRNRGNDTTSYKGTTNKTDYRVYWYGKVDMWLDYVRVDDEWAHFLFTDSLDNHPNNKWKFHGKIIEEVDTFSEHPGLGYFYIDEFAYNNIPCLAEVNRLVKKYSNNKTSVLPVYCLNCITGSAGFKENYDYNELNDSTHNLLKNSGAVSNIYMDEMYPFFHDNLYPHNLEISDYNLQNFPATEHYQQAADKRTYDTVMSRQFKWWLHLYNQTAGRMKSYGSYPFAFIIQIHTDEIPLASGAGWFWREPTNEEISMQSYLALSYGVKHLYQYAFQSHKVTGSNQYYSWGLAGLSQDGQGSFGYNGIREINYFGQNKFEYLKNLNKKIVSIGNYMYPEGEISRHFEHLTTRTVDIWNKSGYMNIYGLPYDFIDSVNSYGHPENSSEYNQPDDSTGRIFEIGFFENPAGQYEKYFLFVNKMCTPEIGTAANSVDSSGDSRKIKFFFIKSALGYIFSNWVLKDVITGEETFFDINNNNGVLFSYAFGPGEGRLLKLAPVMQEGGTLVCDESI